MNFVHLHVHTHYSLLDGLTKIDELIATAKKDGAPAVAMTDHGVMYGAIEFYQKCKKAGIKPIVGLEAYLAADSRLNKVTRSDGKWNYHLLLLAKNLEGYKNLIKLTSIAHLEGFYYKPRIDWEILQKYSGGLIAATACMGGEIPALIRAGKIDKARKRIMEYNKLFGQDNFYLEIQDHPHLEGQAEINQALISLSRELGVPLVATNDVHYLKKDDDEAQDILLCLQNKKKKNDTDRMHMTGVDYSLRPAAEIIEAFKDVPEAIENTVKIAEKCNLEIELGNIQLPFFEVPAGFDGNTYLRKLCEDGLEKRYGKAYAQADKAIQERLDFELSVISKMGWPSYFLIVADFVNWAKANNIVVGPGRGSAAGSLVCYLTRITNIDPLKYDLLFERFLNPDRVSMPDIDLDFADIRRDEVIRYVEDKYGKDHVAQIITFGTMAARAAVRDVGRVLDYPYDYCDQLAKRIPMFCSLSKALNNNEELREVYEKEEGAKRIIDYAKRLEGVARHSSTHACGVLITKEPLQENVPIQHASSSDRTIVSQYSLHPIEDLGLLKIDFLGLKNLTIIESAIKIIKNTRGVEINIDTIPLGDQAAYKLFRDGETTGVFQFESSGMKRYLRELKPNDLEDIIAMVALYRPGPIELIPDYINRKHGRKKIEYVHPALEQVLAKTYGVAVYQEQIMQISRVLAGFTKGEADVLRKAVGKKIPELLIEQKNKFIEGCVKNSINKGLAEKIWAFIEPFAGYGFNRSHAACYALIAYQTAYLKAHWPTEFMAALLTADQQNIDRLAIEIDECRRMGIEVRQPDINQSFETFTVVTSGTEKNEIVGAEEEVRTIRFGLHAIKNIGENIAKVLIKERKTQGPYRDISDILERITDKDLNKKSLESLIKSGGLDKFGERGMLLSNIETMLAYNKELAKSKNNGQGSLFGSVPSLNTSGKIRLDMSFPPAKRQDFLAWEKELLGLYITEHPFSDFRKHLLNIIVPLNELKGRLGQDEANVAGIITKVKKIITRNNKAMLFARIEDHVYNAEVLVFPNLLKQTAAIWQEGKTVICQGKLSDKDQDVKLLANIAIELSLDNIEKSIEKFKKAAGKRGDKSAYSHGNNYGVRPAYASPVPGPRKLTIVFQGDINADSLNKLKTIFMKHPGQNQVLFEVKEGGSGRTIETAFRVNFGSGLAEELRANLGNTISLK